MDQRQVETARKVAGEKRRQGGCGGPGWSMARGGYIDSAPRSVARRFDGGEGEGEGDDEDEGDSSDQADSAREGESG